MASFANVSDALPRREPAPVVLAVCSSQREQLWLSLALTGGDWQVRAVASVGAAVSTLRGRDHVFLVICEKNLADGTWRDVLVQTDACPAKPLLVVTSRHADEHLWAEVLNLGGYDLLMQPMDPKEVHQVLTMAWHHWNSRSHTPPLKAQRQFAEALSQWNPAKVGGH